MSAKSPTKTEIFNGIVKATGLKRTEVAKVFEALNSELRIALDGNDPKAPGVFKLPGLFKIMVVNKPATPARKGINPFTKQECTFAAKPARKQIKVRPLQDLKDATSR